MAKGGHDDRNVYEIKAAHEMWEEDAGHHPMTIIHDEKDAEVNPLPLIKRASA